MYEATVSLESITPYSQSKGYLVPKLNDKEGHAEYELRTCP